MAVIGYARVSSTEQNEALQLDALNAAGAIRIFTDRASGAVDDRPQLAAALDYVRAGDTFAVWRLDRLGRSLRHLIDTVNDLHDREIEFLSVTEGMDTRTAGGELVFNIFGSVAQFERRLIQERTNAGLAAARARGRKGGRPPVMTPQRLRVARRMRAEHATLDEIARTIGVSRATVVRALSHSDVAPEGAAQHTA